jgi:cell division protein ZapA (FtsZ GTPase activity inhibitor)
MIDELQKYKVTVCDEHYSLVSDESEVHVKKAASMVDSIIKDIVTHSPSIDIKKAAILAAIKLASALVTADTRTEQLAHAVEKTTSLLKMQ